MHTILWEFRVSAERRAAFEAAYGADGPWALLFARAKGFLSVELLRCGDEADRYVTVDRWRSRADFEAFKRDFGTEYAALDRQLDGIAERETRIGTFDSAAGS
jgi:heme-degrading monooxygenase HmoA